MRFRPKFAFLLVLVPLALAAMAWVVMSLWNWVVPGLFVGAHDIDFLHAAGLLVLCRLLVGGFRGHGGWHGRRHWQRWEAMTPEERAAFQQRMAGRRWHCGGGRDGADPGAAAQP